MRSGPPPPTLSRTVAVVLILLVAIAAGAALWFTPTGRALRLDPHRTAGDLHLIVADHPLASPVAFLAAYLTLSVLCLPVWWLQVIAGVAFGLWAGGGLCLLGSAVGSGVTASLADWFAGRWVHGQLEPRLARLRWFDDALGHHGLLVVMAVRLTHLLPFGLSNVALGLTRVSPWSIVIGTAIGNVPAVAVYVELGAHRFPRGPFAAVVVVVNALLLLPLVARLWAARKRWNHGGTEITEKTSAERNGGTSHESPQTSRTRAKGDRRPPARS